MNTEIWEALNRASVSKSEQDFGAAEKAILAAKFKFVTYGCFDSEAAKTHPPEKTAQELKLVTNVLEAAVLLSIAKEDAQDFERNFMELENICLSEDSNKTLGISEHQPFIFAVAMLWHLSKNNLEQFHLLVRRCIGVKEGLPPSECWTFFGVPVTSLSAKDQEFLNFPLSLEREIMDGNIAAVLAAANEKLPDPRFGWCVQGLVATLRQRVATSLKCAYKEMPFEHAMKLLAFKNSRDLISFIEADRQQQDVLASAANAAHESSQLFAVRWSRSDSQSAEVQERPSTPSALPKAGEGKLFSALARTSSTGSQTKAFTLGQAKSAETELKTDDQNKATRALNLDGAFLKSETVRGSSVQWQLTETSSGGKGILFKETSPKKPLIPAGELMQQWLDYVIDLEMVV
eukprot:Protomagalhaensia_wolfi_Nauph_80__2964@NODE_303_length_2850_cov_366_283885_g227_i0_p1_GENE_NODE_303_length_2850_cov_366_283885_g227_i0NODE_303_length_2850_cov_366_283885_g227_i0_p1_ORF_typecomplete_len404_score89_06CSN8_PSD8_EIF3K/PF10075_9/8_2e15SAC3_GANP/PF03399_16/0_012_NODE_303_length_2850_cov_366_283885_g227_i014232634